MLERIAFRLPRRQQVEDIVRGAGAIVSIVAPPVGMGVLGYYNGMNSAETHNIQAAARAERLRNCLDFVGEDGVQRRVLLASVLPEQREVCELPEPHEVIIKTNDSRVSVDLATATVELPSGSELGELLEDVEADSREIETSLLLMAIGAHAAIGLGYSIMIYLGRD